MIADANVYSNSRSMILLPVQCQIRQARSPRQVLLAEDHIPARTVERSPSGDTGLHGPPESRRHPRMATAPPRRTHLPGRGQSADSAQVRSLRPIRTLRAQLTPQRSYLGWATNHHSSRVAPNPPCLQVQHPRPLNSSNSRWCRRLAAKRCFLVELSFMGAIACAASVRVTPMPLSPRLSWELRPMQQGE